MKKISLLLLAILLVCGLFVLTSCGGNDTNTDSGSTNTDAGSQPEVDEDLNAAYNYIKLTYKTLGTTTKSFEVMKNAPIGDKIFAITWSTDNEAVTITESEDGNFYIVNVPELGDTALNYSLKFSIENEKGEKKMGSFSLTVPAFSVNTFEEYAAAEDGTALVVQGIVTGVISKTDGNKENSIFVQDFTEGGYYVYGLEEDPKGTVSVGMTVEVRGNKKNYSGTYELVDATVTVIDSSINPVEPVDFTEIFASADSLDAAELTGVQGMLVTIKGVTILEYNDGNGYHNFQLGNHKSYLRVSSSSNCITKDEGKTLTENFQANFYNAADVTGIIAVYSGNMYLMPASVDAFTNIVEQVKPDNVKVDTALENTTLPGIIQVNGTTNLPTSFSGFSDVAISWELVAAEGVDCAAVRDNVLSVTVPESAQTITLKATAACGEYSDTKDFEIVVKPISTITIQEANNIGMNMAHNTYTEELYYIVGTIDSIASDVYGNLYLVDETGEYSIYVYGIYDETGNVRYDKMDPRPLVKDTIKVLSPVGKYKNDVQLKNAKVIEHTVHPDNEGAVIPDDYTEMTIPEALAAADNTKVKVSGTVISIDGVWNENFGNMTVTIADADGNELYIYRVTTKVEVGDIITVKGTLTTYNDKKQIGQGGTATIDGHDSSYDYVEMTISEALAAEDGKNVIVVGTVSKIGTEYSSQYNNISVYIKDDAGNELYIYRLTGDVAVGTTIKVTGSMTTYKENRQLVGGTFEVVTNSGDSGDSGDTCEHTYENGTCTKCGASDPDYVKTVTIVEALASEVGANIVVSGTVCEIYQPWSDTYGNISVYITDGEGNKFLCFQMTTLVVKGDIITVTGVVGEYNGVKQLAKGCTAVKTGHDESYDVGPTEMSIADALKAADGTDVIVKGTVIEASAWSSSYGNMNVTIKDENGDELYIYRLGTQVELYDVITVTGSMATYNGARQIAQGATATVNSKHTCTEFTDATCTKAAACTTCGKVNGSALGHNYAEGVCTVCGAEQPVAGETVLPENLVFTGLVNKASADAYMAENFPEWTITGKLGTGYADYLGFGRGGGDAASSIKSTAISTSSAFTVTAVIKGNGSNGAMTSTLTFTLVDASGNVVATGYANGSTTAAITPVDAKDTTYNISFTFVEGKTWSDVSNLVVSYAKDTGNIGLKSLDFVQ